MPTAKSSASELINEISVDATQDDIMYELYVKQKIEAGLMAVDEKRVTPHEAIKARLLHRKRFAS